MKVLAAIALMSLLAPAYQDPQPEIPKSAPEYQNTFSGSIVELSAEKLVVARSILGEQEERHSFLIKQDTKIEGKLKVNAKVTVGFVGSDEGDVARLIVVREQKK